VRFDVSSVRLEEILWELPTCPQPNAINRCACEGNPDAPGLDSLQFAKTLGVSFQSVNRWERGKTKPLPIILKQIEGMVQEMGDRGQDLLNEYFAD
jgi:transcriptional regulator with XRE-family HTH domain